MSYRLYHVRKSDFFMRSGKEFRAKRRQLVEQGGKGVRAFEASYQRIQWWPA